VCVFVCVCVCVCVFACVCCRVYRVLFFICSYFVCGRAIKQ
jgi:hypothetical protein